MSLSKFLQRSLQLPGRIALLTGLGALSATSAQATGLNLGGEPASTPDRAIAPFGGLAVWVENGQIHVSEPGQPGRELRLGNTPEGRELRTMLEQNGAVAEAKALRLDRMLLAGGGGAGIHWAPATRNGTAPTQPAATGFGPAASSPPSQATPPANLGAPRQSNPRELPDKG